MPRGLSGNHCAVSVDAGSPRTVFETTLHSSSIPPFRYCSLKAVGEAGGLCVKPLGVLLHSGRAGMETEHVVLSRAVFLELSFSVRASCVGSASTVESGLST